jgi:undecaprenyl diphosphate synthase
LKRVFMQHLAIIPDGNRRWARKNKLEAFLGHKKGLDAVRAAIKVSLANGIKYLSFYTFSLENLKRQEQEKEYLFNLMVEGVAQELPNLIKEGINIRFLGDTSCFPEKLRPVIHTIEHETRELNKLYLNLLFFYGGRQEILSVIKTIAQKVKDGILSIDQINTGTIDHALWTAGIPDPDLIIRTSGMSRLSNFLCYQSAYSELMFLDNYWPEITEAHLNKCINDFKTIKRNFGT